MKKNSVILGDNEKILPTFSNSFIDLVITAPPFDGAKMDRGYELDLPLIGKEFKRILKPGGVCILYIQDAFIQGGKSLTAFKTAVDWCKNAKLILWADYVCRKATMNKNSIWWKRRPCQNHDYIFVFVNGNKPKTFHKEFTGYTILDYQQEWRESQTQKRPKGMHTPLPKKIIKDMLNVYSNEGDLILDPFCGSGNVLYFSKIMKRNYLGIEIKKPNYDYAFARLNKNCGFWECY